jgi:Galactose oxidase, central domain
MKPNLKPLFLAILVLTSGLAGCNLRKQTSGSTSGSGSGPGTTPTTQTIGGTVTGLTGTGMVLQDNGGDDLPIKANGAFTFKTAVSGAYAVTIKTQPSGPAQSCTVAFGSGTATTNVNNVQINCGSGLTVGGSVSGLIGSGLVLQNNGGNNFQVTGTGNVAFTFSSPITAGTTYAVTVLTQPSNPTQTCFVANGTGTVNGNITNVQITCSQPAFHIGGSVVGLLTGPGDTLELQDNAGDNLFVTGDTTFTFPTTVTYGGIYNVDVFAPPTSQPQPCNLFFYTGIALADVFDVVIDCQHNDWNFISYYIAGTEKSNNYAAITTPLFPAGVLPPPNLGMPGGRDFAASWTDAAGRKWLFGGQGYPYPSPYGNQLPALLNDLWVFDGTWVPANLPTFINKAGDWVVDPTPMEQTFARGVYGTLNSASGGAPGARWGSTTWTDAAGNLWMFGGQGINATGGEVLLNDMWEWIPGTPPSALPVGSSSNAGTFTGQWIWRGGSSSGNQNGTYGSKGVASASNLPGGRWAAATYTDSSGNVWLFGGQGYDASGNLGILGDLWKYNIASGQWTWVAGPNLASPNGVYGTKGTAAAANAPGGRQAAVLWVDVSGNLWLFGGFGFDSAGTGSPQGAILNDLWEFTGGQWTWISGNNVGNQTGVYGTQTAAAAANFPGARWGAAGWTDASSNLWFYGGWGYGSVSTDPTGFLDDIWEYQHSTAQWIWWKGTSGVNQASQYSALLGFGLPYVKNVAGARRGAALWKQDANGDVWVFGGEGYDFSSGNPPGYLDDLWTYLPFP